MNKLNKIIILDNGHGQETPGKRSPDGLFREYSWTRNFVQRLKYELEYFGYKTIILVPEDEDISLYVLYFASLIIVVVLVITFILFFYK